MKTGPSTGELRCARDRFRDLPARPDSREIEFQHLFADHPFILSEGLTPASSGAREPVFTVIRVLRRAPADA
jgi:hypothetical protein